jgi:RNA polymerase sigma-70 factor (ECF subfamily)
MSRNQRRLRPVPGPPERASSDQPVTPRLEDLMILVARGDHGAFEKLYDRLAPAVFGVVRRVLRDPGQSEEVTQEVLVDVWRTASRYDEARGSVQAWVMTIAHRRAVDRVRSEQSAGAREQRVGRRDTEVPYDEVAGAVESRLEGEAVRRCLASLTELQRESVLLAYYGGYTYREVGELLDVPLGTVKTRIRDCLGVVVS